MKANIVGNFSQYIPGYADGFDHTAPVGSFPNAASRHGLLDMAGNVWEWVQDDFGPFASASVTDPLVLTDGQVKVGRGGGWDRGAHHQRAYVRDYWRRDQAVNRVGIRVARDAE